MRTHAKYERRETVAREVSYACTAVFLFRNTGGRYAVTGRAADRTVVFPVVGQAQEKPEASSRRFNDEFVERNEKALVVNPGRGLKRSLALEPLVLKSPYSDNVQLQALRVIEHLIDPRVLVRAVVGARGVREVEAVGAGDAEGRAVLAHEPSAVRGNKTPCERSLGRVRAEREKQRDEERGGDGGKKHGNDRRSARAGRVARRIHPGDAWPRCELRQVKKRETSTVQQSSCQFGSEFLFALVEAGAAFFSSFTAAADS